MYVKSGIILVIFLTGSVRAGHLNITAEDIGDGQLQIGYHVTMGDSGPVGLSFNVEVSHNAFLNLSDGLLETDAHFDILIDTFDLNPLEEPLLFPPDPPGPSTLSNFTISAANLDNDSPLVVPNLITLQLNNGGAGYSIITLTEDTLRGGSPGFTMSFPEPLLVVLPEPVTLSLLGIGALLLVHHKRRQPEHRY
mgnify:CR=1 FL=1